MKTLGQIKVVVVSGFGRHTRGKRNSRRVNNKGKNNKDIRCDDSCV